MKAMAVKDKEIIFMIRVVPQRESMNDFLNWQMRYNNCVAASPGFISLEITLSTETQDEWVITERFNNIENLSRWQQSTVCHTFSEELKKYAFEKNIRRQQAESDQMNTGVTEVIVTRVSHGREQEFREWMAKIHQAEAQFPGFRGAYVQAPSTAEGLNWITLLQFDTTENLNHWLFSKERAGVIEEAGTLITSLENHRVISPYAGWFASVSKDGESPSAWKQAMIVLLVLYPIVMLEGIFLNPSLRTMDLSLKIFIGNTLSIILVTWVMMPIAIWFLSWWLIPKHTAHKRIAAIGTLLVFLLYCIEIAIFYWHS